MSETERSEWSVPERELMASIRERLDADGPAMLATVVDVRGSAYRRPGAKMVVSPTEGGVGAITAGCLEDEVRNLADRVIDDGEPTLETFDLTGDDDEWGLGVGCNGIIDLFLEPLDEGMRPAVEAYKAGEAITVATVVASDDEAVDVGERGYSDDFDGLPEEVGDAIRAADIERSRTIDVETDEGTVTTVFVDRIVPPTELVILGGGHDVAPVVDLALNVDFRVTVATFRGADRARERFPDADRVLSSSPRSLTDDVAFDGDTYVVVMSHNFIDDRLALADLLATDVPYVGLMGPQERFEQMIDEFEEEGEELGNLDPVYTPVGLDLGGGAPYQVAHSIVAEALAVKNGREGSHLRAVDGTVHDRAETPSETR